MNARLVAIELENFRGFRDSQAIDLDADIVLVRGDNGSGKTSLTDGILWLLTGDLTHLSARVKGLRQTHDPIQNRYGQSPSRVSLTLRSDAGTWTFERRGGAKESRLTVWRDGREATGDDWLGAVFGEERADEVRSAVSTWGILRQDAIRSVLDTGGAALHERMSSVIGLSEVTRFQEACRAATKSLPQERRRAQDAYSSAQAARMQADRALQQRQGDVQTNSATLAERLAASVASATMEVAVDLSDITELNQVVELGQEVSSLIEAATAAADAYDTRVRSAAAVGQTSVQLESDLLAAEAQAAELGRLTSDTQRLAEAALGLLGDECPVCKQAIDPEAVRAQLQADLERNRTRLIAAAEARNAVAALQQRLVDARTAEAGLAQSETMFARRNREFSDALSASTRVSADDSIRRPEGLRALSRRLDQIRSSLRQVYAEVRAESDADETRAVADVSAAIAEEGRRRSALEDLVDRHDTAKRLDKAAQAAADRIVARWLQELEPSFAEVFDRLSPHPTFSELRARQDVYYNKNQIVPEVFDPIRNVAANPLLVYSEGQLNTVALSYFLGLALNAPSPALGFMVLDDPLQAMDVLAVLGFADLCRRLRRERQLIITTHDRRYADLLARKLAPREASQSTLTHEFDSWSASGPRITSTRQDFRVMPAVVVGGGS